MRRPLPGGIRLPKRGPARIALAMLLLAGALFGASPTAQAQTAEKKVLLYTGSMAFRHADAITQGAPVLKSALEAQGFTVDWKDCNGNGCYSPENNPAIFTPANLAQYDVVFFSNASGAQNFTAASGRRSSISSRRAAASAPTTAAPTWGRRR